MNGLICYRIVGGELTDIVASYNGDFTIGQENDRKHTTKITIAGYTGSDDKLNVAIQITTNGKSVLHKSTRIICKEGVIIAYDLEIAELGDDTDIMVELSKSLTTYLSDASVGAFHTSSLALTTLNLSRQSSPRSTGSKTEAFQCLNRCH